MSSLPSGLPDQIEPGEDIARFLTQSSQFTAGAVRPSAFLPNPKDRETSVSRHGRIPLEILWKLGAAAAGDRTLHGAAIIKASAIAGTPLSIVADEPPEFHAAIRDWPWPDDLDERKAQQKRHALILASAAGEPILCVANG